MAVLGIDFVQKSPSVRVYEYCGNQTSWGIQDHVSSTTTFNRWQQIHADINATNSEGQLALSGDGSVLVFGEETYNNQATGLTETAGQVRIFVRRQTEWEHVFTKKGNPTIQFDRIGKSVGISLDGKVAIARSGGGYDDSHVTAFATP